MRDVDAINRRYEPGLIKTYMTKEAALNKHSRRRHPNSYAIPNMRYVNRHLAADPPHISDINAGDPVAASTLMMTLCSPITILKNENCKPFEPTCVTETSVNKLVMHSIEGDTIIWAPLDTGFPTVPWQISQVWNKFSFHLMSPLPAAKFNMLQKAFAGISIAHHLTMGTDFLDSDKYLIACQGFDAADPIAGTDFQQAWLQSFLEHTESACGSNITCMILSIPWPSASAGRDIFDACMIRPAWSNTAWAYKSGIVPSALCQDIVAATRWVYVSTRARGSQQQQVPLLKTPLPTQRKCYSCMDARHDLAENGICTVTQLDADRMHATPASFGFLPVVLAHTAPPESCATDRNISVLRPSFPCIEPMASSHLSRRIRSTSDMITHVRGTLGRLRYPSTNVVCICMRWSAKM
jgi:hypothetical protein